MKHPNGLGYSLLFVSALWACKGSEPGDTPQGDAGRGDAVATECHSELEGQMNATLSALTTDADFSFRAESKTGKVYEFSKGSSTMQTPYESASTSKWVAAAVILRAVEQELVVDGKSFSLDSLASDWIEDWPIDQADPLAAIRLRDLLNFTSGLTTEPLCVSLGGPLSYAKCVSRVAAVNAGSGEVPSEEFYYESTHLQVAGMMTIAALEKENWGEVFAAFQQETSLFPNSAFDLPTSASGPRLAGGMHWTGDDYFSFIKAMWNENVLSSELQTQMFSDQIANATIVDSPASFIQEEWHYGFGGWIECHNATFNCTEVIRVSSPGAFGAYPFIDFESEYIGMVARKGALGSFPEGVAVARSISTLLAQWAQCPSS